MKRQFCSRCASSKRYALSLGARAASAIVVSNSKRTHMCMCVCFLPCLLLIFVYLMNCEWRTQQLHDVVLKLESGGVGGGGRACAMMTCSNYLLRSLWRRHCLDLSSTHHHPTNYKRFHSQHGVCVILLESMHTVTYVCTYQCVCMSDKSKGF